MEDPGWEFGTVKGVPAGMAGAAAAAPPPKQDKARVLKGVIKPALEKIKAAMKEENPERSAADLALISELSKAFELAETSKTGICESITQEICTTMLSL